MSVPSPEATGTCFLAAAAAKVTLWPFALLLALVALTLLAGGALYREPGDRQDEAPGRRVTG